MRHDALPPTGVLLGVDYGKARIGLARCDETRLVVTPLMTLHIKGKSAAAVAEELMQHTAKTACVGLIFGWPDEDDARTEAVRNDIAKLVGRLRGTFSLLCAFVPESFSSRDALDFLREAKKKRAASRALDPYAAAVILQRYLDAQGGK
jgi:putative Holliday junction resolvase